MKHTSASYRFSALSFPEREDHLCVFSFIEAVGHMCVFGSALFGRRGSWCLVVYEIRNVKPLRNILEKLVRKWSLYGLRDSTTALV